MSTAGNTPNFVAETAIYPFRCVKIGSANFSAVPSTGDPEILLGVTDGSVRDFNSQYHATAGQPVSLQNGEFVQLTASGTISVGDLLIATTDGKVMADTVATEYVAQAADNATDGEVFWAKRIGAWTVGGGGGGAMTIDVQEFDNPEAENTWVKPAGAVWVTVRMCGAGQDGQTGNFNYGGNGGTIAEKHFNATSLPASVGIVIGVHQPFGMADDDGTTAFGAYLYAGMAAAFGPNGSDSGGSTIEYCGGLGGEGRVRFGQGENMDMMVMLGGNQGFAFGPGGGGACFTYEQPTDVLRVGGKASTNGAMLSSGNFMRVASGGGGAAGAADGIGPGGNGGNGSIDSVTGFGDGGGAGGYGGPGEAGGNGGNAFHGGGGGAAGKGGGGFGGNDGLPGSGGDGYVRVTTICYN